MSAGSLLNEQAVFQGKKNEEIDSATMEMKIKWNTLRHTLETNLEDVNTVLAGKEVIIYS
jgi:hypothetical protein